MFQDLLKNPVILAICTALAFIPIVLYMWFFLKKDPEPKRLIIKTFLFGCLSVVPLAIMQYFFSKHPEYDVYSLIKGGIPIKEFMWIAMYLFVGATEEYVKHWVVVLCDGRDKGFRRIVDGIELSIIAALGFSFVEHIVYFISIYNREGWEGFLVPFIFRSILTTLAHASFSGIFGYYYGKSHFMKSAWHRDRMILRGLISAMTLHAIYNTFLEFNIVWAIVPLLMVELGFILYELQLGKNKIIHYGRDEA